MRIIYLLLCLLLNISSFASGTNNIDFTSEEPIMTAYKAQPRLDAALERSIEKLDIESQDKENIRAFVKDLFKTATAMKFLFLKILQAPEHRWTTQRSGKLVQDLQQDFNIFILHEVRVDGLLNRLNQKSCSDILSTEKVGNQTVFALDIEKLKEHARKDLVSPIAAPLVAPKHPMQIEFVCNPYSPMSTPEGEVSDQRSNPDLHAPAAIAAEEQKEIIMAENEVSQDEQVLASVSGDILEDLFWNDEMLDNLEDTASLAPDSDILCLDWGLEELQLEQSTSSPRPFLDEMTFEMPDLGESMQNELCLTINSDHSLAHTKPTWSSDSLSDILGSPAINLKNGGATSPIKDSPLLFDLDEVRMFVAPRR